MILLFISAILVSFTGLLFSLNFSMQGLNRAVINTPIELLYRTVSYEDDRVEEDLSHYYSKSLSRYCKDYTVDYYFYNKSDGSMCLNNRCDAVEITVSCKLIMNYTFYRVMYYELRGK